MDFYNVFNFVKVKKFPFFTSAVCILAFQVTASSQRASVKSNKSPSQRFQPTLTSHGFGFMFVAAKENGGNFGQCADEVWKQGGRPADNRGPTAEGRFSHPAPFPWVLCLYFEEDIVFSHVTEKNTGVCWNALPRQYC